MREEREMERLLAQSPAPCLRDGPHREHLKAKLLHTRPSTRRGLRITIRLGGLLWPTRLMKLAAGVMVAVVLVATGWTAERVYRSITGNYVELERIDVPPESLPDGSMLGGAFGVATYIPSDAPREPLRRPEGTTRK